uniref:Immunoglobulin V-set domain-containing protein n=1 Tax=Paramormyrops kingsleyae TaxID=1676925 RepID=A0A3B3TG67_9TELE
MLFFFIAGVCVAVDLTVNGSVGGTVELPSVLGSLKVEDFQSLRWTFNDMDIAEKFSDQTEVDNQTQFKGRLQLSPDFSLTVRELRLEDSGEYELSSNVSCEITSVRGAARVSRSMRDLRVLPTAFIESCSGTPTLSALRVITSNFICDY